MTVTVRLRRAVAALQQGVGLLTVALAGCYGQISVAARWSMCPGTGRRQKPHERSVGKLTASGTAPPCTSARAERRKPQVTRPHPRATLFAPESESSMPSSLVLFIHGLGGHPDHTWGSFPALLRGDRDTSGIEVGFFSYPTSLFRLPFTRKAPRVQTLAGALQTLIENRFRGHDEITLVCHSLGGLIGKQYLIDQLDQDRPVRVRHLLLFAVPNNGAALAAVARNISWRHGQLRQLCRESDVVINIASAWQRREIARTLDVRYVVAGLDSVVDEHSARESWGNVTVDVIADCDHRSIVKPTSTTDLAFLILKHVLLGDSSAGTVAHIPALPKSVVHKSDSAVDSVIGTSDPIGPNQDIRVSMSALVRIAAGDKYVLVRNLHRPESFAPLGGVYKCGERGQCELDRFEFRPQAIDGDMFGDLRGFLPNKHLPSFLEWFASGIGRETAHECLSRELSEELKQADMEVRPEEIAGLRFVHVRTVHEGPDHIAAERYLQRRIFDVYDPVADSVAARELVGRIKSHASTSKEMVWATSQEIIRGRHRQGHVIGAHSPYLFGQTRYRSQDPAFIVG
jgi:pimeloyl-ACP methyl ester carboxylesterase